MNIGDYGAHEAHLEAIAEDWSFYEAYGHIEEDEEYEYCALCGDKLRPRDMSKEIDGYCLQCVAEIIGSVNAMALRELTAEEYDLCRKIFSPLEEVE